MKTNCSLTWQLAMSCKIVNKQLKSRKRILDSEIRIVSFTGYLPIFLWVCNSMTLNYILLLLGPLHSIDKTEHSSQLEKDEIHFTCFKIDFEIKHGIKANNLFGRIDISNPFSYEMGHFFIPYLVWEVEIHWKNCKYVSC